MGNLLLNARKIDFQNTLGVTAYFLNLAKALSKQHDLTLIVNADSNWRASEWAVELADFTSDIISADRAEAATARYFDHIEICPHHFQEMVYCRRGIVICHDLHIFDIPWKYKEVEQKQAKFRETMTRASAIMTHFPRTYYRLEAHVGRTIPNLFMTEAPLIFDALRQVSGAPAPRSKSILFPAQFQEHKGHRTLIEAAKKLADAGEAFELLFCGSDFEPAFTEQLRSRVTELGIAERVKFLGRVTDEQLANLYRDCAGVITASAAEGGAYVPIEAIACGKPVAVNGIEAARMHLKALRAEVIWFDANDAVKTAEAMRQLLGADVAAYAQKNETARKRIAAASWGNVADSWTKVIQYLSGGGLRPIQSMDGEGWRVGLQ